MKVLLTTINSKYIHQNLAIRLLYALNKDYKGLNWKEFINKDSTDEIASYCANYQVITFSCYIWNISKTLEVAAQIKHQNPDSLILFGGPEVSYEWEEIIKLDTVDFIITGEGELPFSQFLKSFPNLENVPALIWKKKGQIIENQPDDIFDLENLADINPYSEDSPEELKTKISYIETSRGCPHTCEFCLAGLDNKVRYLPKQSIEANLLYLMKNGKVIKFLDRTFNTHPKFAISIFKFILENYTPGNVFQFEIKADIIQNELIAFIREHVPKGIFRFEIGIQTLNEKSNKDIRRRQNFDNIREFIAQVSDKIELHLDLIVGLPQDYWNDIKFSFEEVFKLYAPELQLGFLKFLKGTPVRNTCQMHGAIFQSAAPYEIIKNNYLSENELDELRLLEKALDIYWNKKRTLNTLRYIAEHYSVFKFLLGLGKYFNSQKGFLKYNLNDVYSIIYDYAKQHFHEDNFIAELIAIDYYLQSNIKPKTLFVSEIDRKQKYLLLDKLRLNHNKFRYIVFSVNAQTINFLQENGTKKDYDLAIFQYDGVNSPALLFANAKAETMNF